jgi:hypothetical protein
MLVYDGSGLRNNYRADITEGFSCYQPTKLGSVNIDFTKVKPGLPFYHTNPSNNLPYALPISIVLEDPMTPSVTSRQNTLAGTNCKLYVPQTITQTLQPTNTICIGLNNVPKLNFLSSNFRMYEVPANGVFSSARSNFGDTEDVSALDLTKFVRIDSCNIVGNRSNIGNFKTLQPYDISWFNKEQPNWVKLNGGSNYQITYSGSTDALIEIGESNNIFSFASCSTATSL